MTSIHYPSGNSVHLDKFLKQIGFNILTGEACGISMRLLCDLNEDGVHNYTQFTGGAIPSADNWNSKVNFTNEAGDYESTPAVKSLMLTRPVLREIVLFKLCSFNTVVEDVRGKGDNGLHADAIYCFDSIEDARAHYEKYRRTFDQPTVYHRRYWNMSTDKGDGLRNRHEFSGRVD